MTTTTVKRLSQSALTNVLTTTLYTVPALTTTIIKEIVITNSDTVDRAVTLRAGAAPATGALSTILAAVNVPAGQTQIYSFSTVLNTTDLITGGAAAGAVVACTISGVEIT